MKRQFLVRSYHDATGVAGEIMRLNPDQRWLVTVEPAKHKRSLQQNKLLWLWNGEIQQHMRDCYGEIASAEEWHEVLVGRLLPAHIVVFRGEPVAVRRSTRKMTVAEMRDYLELLEMYCADELNLKLTRPDEMYIEALIKDEVADSHEKRGRPVEQ